MLAQVVAGAPDLDDDGMVEKAVEERGCDNRIAEDISPLGEFYFCTSGEISVGIDTACDRTSPSSRLPHRHIFFRIPNAGGSAMISCARF